MTTPEVRDRGLSRLRLRQPSGFRFCGACGATSPERGRGRAHVAAERRQLTVLFCDLVGSTRLAATLELEELRDVIRSFQAACAEVVRQYGGTVSRYMGDGILVLFGYPQAHEDDAERAVAPGSTWSRPSPGCRGPAATGRWRCGWDRDRTGGGGRPDRARRRRGGSDPRRDAEPRRPAARLGAAGLGGGRGQHARPARRPLPLRGPRRAQTQGVRRAGPRAGG